jgi:hypothetical protein
VIRYPVDMGAFQFAVLSTLRAKQLIRGCTPRVAGNHKAAVMAQHEVAEGKVIAVSRAVSDALHPPVAGVVDSPVLGTV